MRKQKNYSNLLSCTTIIKPKSSPTGIAQHCKHRSRTKESPQNIATNTAILILLPNILRIGLRQPRILPILLLPLDKPSLQYIHILLFALLHTKRALSLPSVAQRSRRSTLLTEGAVENDLLLVRQRTDEFGHAVVERRAGNPGRRVDVSANVVCNESDDKS